MCNINGYNLYPAIFITESLVYGYSTILVTINDLPVFYRYSRGYNIFFGMDFVIRVGFFMAWILQGYKFRAVITKDNRYYVVSIGYIGIDIGDNKYSKEAEKYRAVLGAGVRQLDPPGQTYCKKSQNLLRQNFTGIPFYSRFLLLHCS